MQWNRAGPVCLVWMQLQWMKKKLLPPRQLNQQAACQCLWFLYCSPATAHPLQLWIGVTFRLKVPVIPRLSLSTVPVARL